MNGMDMVVAIVGISAVASVIRAKSRDGNRWEGFRARRRARNGFADFGGSDDVGLAQENAQLRDEMRGMKERIQVLERLATDDESDARRLDREIEKLRERPGLTGDKSGSGRTADKLDRE